ncbi:MAG: GLUG motif-containing protein [Alloprevotella sp.]
MVNTLQRKTRLLTALLLVATLMLPASVWAQSVATEQPAAGDGTSADPYQIANAAQLAWFRDWVNGTYTPADGEIATMHATACAKLTADIDMSTVCSESLGSWEPISREDLTINWSGTFDGDGHTISNLYVNWTQRDAGMFGDIGYCTIRNITFTGVSITGADNDTGIIGGLLGSVSNVTVADGTISGTYYVGGIAGVHYGGTISHCTSHAQVTAANYSVGGICGMGYGTIEFCTNYGVVKSTADYAVGGIAGDQQGGSISHCANYGNVEGSEDVGGIAGFITAAGSISNVLSTGNVTETSNYQTSGLVVGRVQAALTLSDYAVFSSDATLTSNGTVQTPRGIGDIYTTTGGSVSGETAGYTTAELQSGMVTYLLQSAASANTWGQQLGTDDYPQLGSAHTVYAEGDITITCTGVVSGGSFSNTRPDAEGTVTFNHGTITHHDAMEKTCTADGNVEYWQCDLCHRFFTDEALTAEIADPVVKCTGHSFDYATGSCTVCGETIPSLGAGTHTIQIAAVSGGRTEINGYNLYRFVAPGDGELTVTTSGSWDTYGSLWSSDGTTRLTYNDDGGENSNFQFTYTVTKGTAYYIGVRKYGGQAISDDYTLIISGTWPMTLADGEEYTTAQDVINFTYTRSFSHTNWQPLYVPFAMKSADWTAQGLEVACINNFHEYEEADGSTKVVLEVKKVTTGTLRPNTPYLIRALEAGDKTITLSNVALAEPESKTIDCASVTRLYTFTGIYSEKSSFDADNDYTMTDGSLYHPEGALKPQRWFLTVSSRGDIIDEESAGAAPRQISVSVIGEGEVTGIEDIRIVTSAPRQGIYDLQGRRLAEEPRSGVFIKDGKKVVK